MAFTHTYDTFRRRGWFTSLMCAVLLLGVVAAAAGDLPKDRPNSRRSSGRGLGLAAHISARHIMDRNRVILLLTDVGELGSSGSSVAGGGFWITTTDQYIFSAGPNIGATAPSLTPGKRDTLVFIGGPFSEVAFGSLTFTDKLPNASAAGGGADAGVFWDSTDPEDAANFPEPCTVDATRTTDFPSLSPFAGEPLPGFADQTVCWATNDVTGGTCADCGGKRLGAEIITTAFAFGVPLVQDFVFVAFRIFNRTDFLNATTAPIQPPGPYDLTGVTVAIAADHDIGDAGDDQIAFLPDVQTMVGWDSDFNEPAFQNPLGFVGITYLKTPEDPVTGEEVGLAEFTVFTNGGARPDPSDKEEWYKLMTGDVTEVVFEVAPQDVRGMASSGLFTLPQDEFVEVYAAIFFATVSGAPPAELLAEGYKSLTTGEIDPTANTHPAFDNFKLVQQTAQATFDAGFVVPTAPPKPNFELIPGDKQVTIVFDAGPVTAVNPFAKVARDPFARLGSGQPDPDAPGTGVFIESGTVVFIPSRDQGGTTGFITADEAGIVGQEITNPAFNPAFVVQDFQGFRIYRSRGGSSTDAELIAQFDLADAITGGFFCVEAIGVFDETGALIQAVCQEVEEQTLGTNTGLSFAVIDRGGSFPNPADGPGLINGIPVFYTVTSYAVNCGQTPGVPAPIVGALTPPAGCLVLEGGLAPFKEATPRSNSSAFAAGGATFTPLKSDGSECNASETAATVDATTGHYTDFIECSNAIWEVSLVPARDVNIPSED
ncbi:MAG: hypothetical protein ABR559_05145, partial [Gemmatimonadota bacterium]